MEKKKTQSSTAFTFLASSLTPVGHVSVVIRSFDSTIPSIEESLVRPYLSVMVMEQPAFTVTRAWVVVVADFAAAEMIVPQSTSRQSGSCLFDCGRCSEVMGVDGDDGCCYCAPRRLIRPSLFICSVFGALVGWLVE